MPDPNHDEQPALAVEHIGVEFGKGPRRLRAVQDVSFEVATGRTMAIVGESGSGKSTLARAISGLVPLSAGSVTVRGKDFTRPTRAQRRHVQMVFQDPYSSLDPSSTIGSSLAEPLIVHERMGRRDRGERIKELLDSVGLPQDAAGRFPHEFSGGQRQRIAIARAIATRPEVLILDEAVSALDVSTQNQIMGLLNELQEQHRLTFVFISHDLGVVRWLGDQTLVMYMGHAVESGPTERVHSQPEHPYSQALLSAMPVPDPSVRALRGRTLLRGEPPSPYESPRGCIFASRCPAVIDVCHTVLPPVRTSAAGGTSICHLETSGSFAPVLQTQA